MKYFLYLIIILICTNCQGQITLRNLDSKLRNSQTQVLTNLIIAYGGQSNAGNRGLTGKLISVPNYNAYIGTYNNVNYTDNSVTYPTRAIYARGVGAGTTAYGMELGIISQLSASVNTIEVIKYFVGGTAIKNHNGTNCFYPTVVGGLFSQGYWNSNNTSSWQTKLSAISQTKPNAIIWIQGEADAALTSTTYLADLTAMVAAIRDGYNDQTIPFFYNQLHIDFSKINGVQTYPVGCANIRADQSSFQSNINIMINMDDIAIGDVTAGQHFTDLGICEMGRRFAQAICTYYNIPILPFTLSSTSMSYDGSYIDITCSKNVVGASTGITLNVNGSDKVFTYSVLSAKLRITPIVPFISTDVVTISSTGSDTYAVDGSTLSDFSIDTVTNNSSYLIPTFTTIGMSYNSSTNVYTGTGVGTACYGQDITHIIGTNGEIRMDNDNIGVLSEIGLDSDITNGNYTTWDYAILKINPTTINIYFNGVVQVAKSIGTYSTIRLRKVGTTVTIDGFKGNPSKWTTIYTFTQADNASTTYGKISSSNARTVINPTIVLN